MLPDRETVTLSGGVTVRADALRLAWRLEHRNVTMTLDREGNLLLTPDDAVRRHFDVNELRAHRDDLKRLVAYCQRPREVSADQIRWKAQR